MLLPVVCYCVLRKHYFDFEYNYMLYLYYKHTHTI